MQQFHHQVDEMLAQIADTLRPRDFDQFAEAAVQELIDDQQSNDA